jgi:ABC-type transport system involved in multi-copper enzyme maturation permease subunit
MSLSARDHHASPTSTSRFPGETIGLAVWLAAVIGWGIWFWRGYPAFGPMHLVTAAVLVLALAILARHGWVRLFGPVLLYEGLRAARRTRFFLLRWLYAIGLLLLLLWVHWIWGMESRYSSTPQDPYKQQAKLAEEFFYAFALVQFAAVVLLTPAYVAGGVAEEKERKTLEFLLATDLRGREIVFGKLLARLGNLGLFVLTGLPVLSLMQFFGGIDPGLLLASFAATALTAISLAALGILLSVQRRRARDAIILTYLAAAGYTAIASASLAIPPLLAEYRRASRQVVPNAVPPTDALDDAWVKTTVDWINAGNPFWGVGQIIYAIDTNGRPTVEVLQEVLEEYAIFHGLFAAVCVTWAVVRLRPIALAQSGSAPTKKKQRFERFRIPRPAVGSLPMLWKEIWIEGRLKFGWFGRILVGLVVGISFIPFIIIVYFVFVDPYHSSINYHHAWDELGKGVNGWVRSVNPIVSSLMLIGVAVRAAGAVGGERDRDTLVSLMTTPITTLEIFWSKWLGSMLSVRLFLVWLGVIWAIGLGTGSVGILAVPMQVIVWLAPASFLAAMGLYCSAACKTTLRATTWAIVGTLFALGGHWVCVGMCCYAPIGMANSGRNMEWLVELQAGLTPPFLFAMVPYRELRELSLDDKGPTMAVMAQLIWVMAAVVVGHLAHERFRQLTNRHEWRRGALPLPPLEPPIVLPMEGV